MAQPERELATRIVAELVCEMKGRRGFRQLWDDIDGDTTEEILDAWIAVVVQQLEQAPEPKERP